MLASLYLKKTGRKVLLILLLVFLLMYLLITLVDSANEQSPIPKEYSVWNKGWKLVDSNGNSASVSLPKTQKYGNGRATISRVLEKNALAGDNVLRLCSKYENINVTLDGETLYSYPTESSGLSDVTGITYHFISLPKDFNGKELKITYSFQSSSSMIYELRSPEIARRDSFSDRAVKTSIPFLVVAVAVAFAGLVIFMMTLRVQNNQTLSNTFWNIGVFALLFALFLVVQSPYAPYLLGNPLGRHFLTYSMVLLMPIPFISMFYGGSDEKYRKHQVIAVILNFVNAFVQTLLALLGVVDYSALLPITLLLIIYSMATVLCGIYLSKNRNEEATGIDDTAFLVAIGAVVDIFLVIIGHPSFCGCLFFSIGVLLFLVAQFSYFLYAYFGQFRTNVETMLLKEMAYKDMLTGIGNRNAYELYLTDITTRPPGDRMYGLIADINDLKRTNDTYGHEMGDTIIVEVGDILFKIFGKNGSCFRVGGDEFVAFIRGMSSEQMEQHIAEFKAELEDYNKDHTPNIRVALGYAETEPDDYRNMKAFLRRIDKMMYEDKRTGKALDKLHAMEKQLDDSALEEQVESSFAVSSVPEISENNTASVSEEPSSDAE